MFRTMRRCKQQLSVDECKAILRAETRGVLSMLGKDGYPYGIPMNHWYCTETGKLYFHGAKEGLKIELLRNHEKVCFTVFEKGTQKEGDWALVVRSVVVFGKMSFVEDEETAKRVCTELCRKFTNDEDYIRRELETSLQHVLCLELSPDHIVGKRVTES